MLNAYTFGEIIKSSQQKHTIYWCLVHVWAPCRIVSSPRPLCDGCNFAVQRISSLLYLLGKLKTVNTRVLPFLRLQAKTATNLTAASFTCHFSFAHSAQHVNMLWPRDLLRTHTAFSHAKWGPCSCLSQSHRK